MEQSEQPEIPSRELSQSTLAETRISIDGFSLVELRVGRVINAEPVPKSTKLLKIQLDTGSGERQIVAGIARAYQPESLIGRMVVYVANLHSTRLMGIESNGMVLAATSLSGEPALLTVDNAVSVMPGTRVS